MIRWRALALLPLLAAAGCHPDEGTYTHKTKLEAFPGGYHGRVSQDSSAVQRSTHMDTTVYVCGVEFDDGYDWRHDGSYGAATGRLVVFRDGSRSLEIPAGAGNTWSLDPDLHHLMGGHIYTESCTAEGTVIGRDGEVLFCYAGREVLRGLVVEGDDVYTLGQSRSGSGFSLRCNGTVIFSSEDGVISGEMSDSPDYPTGALYRDGGHLYFCYCRGVTATGSGKAWFVVEDGRETQVLSELDGSVSYDIRVCSGEISVGRRIYSETCEYLYVSGEERAQLLVFSDGTFSLYAAKAVIPRRFFHTYYIFSWRVAALCGTSVYMAVTPSGEDHEPYLWRDGKTRSMPIDGFLTAVEVVLTQKE